MDITNQPAFPVARPSPDVRGDYQEPEFGMTLRQYYVGQALIALAPCLERRLQNDKHSVQFDCDIVADVAVQLADATIKRLSK